VKRDDIGDQELHELARRLGARAAERLDVDRTARAVLARLADERARARKRFIGLPPVSLRIAAGLVLVIGASALLRTVGRHPAATYTATVTTDAGAGAGGVNLNDLSDEELREVLGTFDQSLDQEPVAATDAGLEDLTAPELRRLLRSLGG
jgi:hypothetical protein